MKFEDLVFKKKLPDLKDRDFGTQATVTFKNGYTASVITGSGAYGGEQGLYELAVLKNGHLCYDTPITDDVIGHLTPDEVTALLVRIEAL